MQHKNTQVLGSPLETEHRTYSRYRPGMEPGKMENMASRALGHPFNRTITQCLNDSNYLQIWKMQVCGPFTQTNSNSIEKMERKPESNKWRTCLIDGLPALGSAGALAGDLHAVTFGFGRAPVQSNCILVHFYFF